MSEADAAELLNQLWGGYSGGCASSSGGDDSDASAATAGGTQPEQQWPALKLRRTAGGGCQRVITLKDLQEVRCKLWAPHLCPSVAAGRLAPRRRQFGA